MRTATLLSALLVAGGWSAAQAQIHPSHQVLVAVNHDTADGALSVFESASPWPSAPRVDKLSRNSIVHAFYGQVYVLGVDDRVVEVRELPSLKLLDSFSIWQVQAPRDLVMAGSRMALISDHDSAHLWWLDTWTGDVTEGPDLSFYADKDRYPDVTRMALVGQHVYVQMQRYDRTDGYTEYGAKLAVLGPAFNPMQPMVVEDVLDLQGTRPDYRMQANPAQTKLWLSAPGVDNDWFNCNRGIEEVDLVARASLGFVIIESQFGGDLGGFAMVDNDKGFAIVHTSIVASTHLRVFERPVGQLAELHMSFGRLETLAFDSVRRQIFYPEPQSGYSAGGVLVFDADNNTQLSGLIDVGGDPVDMFVVQ